MIKFPVQCLNPKLEEIVLGHYPQENELIETDSIEWSNQFLLGHRHWDSNGKIYILDRFELLDEKFKLKNLFSYGLKKTKTYKCFFKLTGEKLSIEEFKLKAIELAEKIYIPEAQQKNIDAIKTSNNYEKIMWHLA